MKGKFKTLCACLLSASCLLGTGSLAACDDTPTPKPTPTPTPVNGRQVTSAQWTEYLSNPDYTDFILTQTTTPTYSRYPLNQGYAYETPYKQFSVIERDGAKLYARNGFECDLTLEHLYLYDRDLTESFIIPENGTPMTYKRSNEFGAFTKEEMSAEDAATYEIMLETLSSRIHPFLNCALDKYESATYDEQSKSYLVDVGDVSFTFASLSGGDDETTVHKNLQLRIVFTDGGLYSCYAQGEYETKDYTVNTEEGETVYAPAEYSLLLDDVTIEAPSTQLPSVVTPTPATGTVSETWNNKTPAEVYQAAIAALGDNYTVRSKAEGLLDYPDSYVERRQYDLTYCVEAESKFDGANRSATITNTASSAVHTRKEWFSFHYYDGVAYEWPAYTKQTTTLADWINATRYREANDPPYFPSTEVWASSYFESFQDEVVLHITSTEPRTVHTTLLRYNPSVLYNLTCPDGVHYQIHLTKEGKIKSVSISGEATTSNQFGFTLNASYLFEKVGATTVTLPENVEKYKEASAS